MQPVSQLRQASASASASASAASTPAGIGVLGISSINTSIGVVSGERQKTADGGERRAAKDCGLRTAALNNRFLARQGVAGTRKSTEVKNLRRKNAGSVSKGNPTSCRKSEDVVEFAFSICRIISREKEQEAVIISVAIKQCRQAAASAWTSQSNDNERLEAQ